MESAFRVLKFKEVKKEGEKRKGGKRFSLFLSLLTKLGKSISITELLNNITLISLLQCCSVLFAFIVEFLCFTIISNNRRISLMTMRADIYYNFLSYLSHLYPRFFMGVILCLTPLCTPQNVAWCLAYSKNSINIFLVTCKKGITCINNAEL